MLMFLPCLDSSEMAESRRRELDISRTSAMELGETAVNAAKNGTYINLSGLVINWHEAVKAACNAKISIPSEAPLPSYGSKTFAETRVQVTNETTSGGIPSSSK